MDAFRCCPPQCLKPRVVGLAVHRYVLSDEHLPENRQIVDRGESQKMAVSILGITANPFFKELMALRNSLRQGVRGRCLDAPSLPLRFCRRLRFRLALWLPGFLRELLPRLAENPSSVDLVVRGFLRQLRVFRERRACEVVRAIK